MQKFFNKLQDHFLSQSLTKKSCQFKHAEALWCWLGNYEVGIKMEQKGWIWNPKQQFAKAAAGKGLIHNELQPSPSSCKFWLFIWGLAVKCFLSLIWIFWMPSFPELCKRAKIFLCLIFSEIFFLCSWYHTFISPLTHPSCNEEYQVLDNTYGVSYTRFFLPTPLLSTYCFVPKLDLQSIKRSYQYWPSAQGDELGDSVYLWL